MLKHYIEPRGTKELGDNIRGVIDTSDTFHIEVVIWSTVKIKKVEINGALTSLTINYSGRDANWLYDGIGYVLCHICIGPLTSEKF